VNTGDNMTWNRHNYIVLKRGEQSLHLSASHKPKWSELCPSHYTTIKCVDTNEYSVIAFDIRNKPHLITAAAVHRCEGHWTSDIKLLRDRWIQALRNNNQVEINNEIQYLYCHQNI
jgi:hypothetical protein